MQRRSRYLASSLLAFTLIGCGGSNSDTSGGSVSLLKGVAIDDLIVNGKVVAYPAGEPDNILVEGITDEKTGAYSLKVDYEGVVVLAVTCGEHGKMYNPTTNTTRSCESNLKLHSAAMVSDDAPEIEVNISPLSELVVAQMNDAQNENAKEAFKAARENIGLMFDVDPIAESPVENDKYAKTVSAIRKLADQKKVSLNDVLDEISSDMEDGITGNDGDIADELVEVIKKEGVTNTFVRKEGKVSVNQPASSDDDTDDKDQDQGQTTGSDDKESGNNNGNPKPDPKPTPKPTPTPAEDIASAKAFFNSLRTQAMSIVDYDESGTPGFLDEEAKNLGEKTEEITLNTNIAAEYSVGLLNNIVYAIDNNLTSYDHEIDDDYSDGSTGGSSSTSTYHESRAIESDSTREVAISRETDPKVWNYSITEDGSEIAAGKITLPMENLDDLSIENFTELIAKMEGTLPLGKSDEEKSGVQRIKMDIDLKKTASGASLLVKELSLSSSDSTVILENLKGSVDYTFDKTKSEDEQIELKFVQFDEATLKATIPSYTFSGKLSVPAYAINRGISKNGFVHKSYTTNIQGSLVCMDEHNALNYDIKNALVIYTDASGQDHQIEVHNHNWFHTEIDGNVAKLDPDNEDKYAGASSGSNSSSDHNYSKYIGLKFDNVEITSTTCNDIKIEELNLYYRDGKTNVNIRAFCADDGKRSQIDDVTGSYRDKTGATHTLNVSNNTGGYDVITYFYATIDGNPEGIEPTRAELDHHYDLNRHSLGFDRISVESRSCEKPIVNHLRFDVGTTYNDNGFETHILVNTACLKEVDGTTSVEMLDDANVTYTDPSGNSVTLKYNGGDFFFVRIKGNIENLPLNVGNKNYRAAGFFNITNRDDVTISSQSCSNPVLSYFDIDLDSHESFYNSGKVPSHIVLEGNITNTTSHAQLDGLLDVVWKNAATMLKGDDPQIVAGFRGMIKRPDYKDMIMMIGYDNFSKAPKHQYTFSYAYDTTRLNATGLFDRDMENGSIVLTSHNGLKAIVKVVAGDIVYGAESSISRDGRKIGQLELRNKVPVIKYTDGTFESLP
jgi:hypothetical protein